jgi:hypothetical protein
VKDNIFMSLSMSMSIKPPHTRGVPRALCFRHTNRLSQTDFATCCGFFRCYSFHLVRLFPRAAGGSLFYNFGQAHDLFLHTRLPAPPHGHQRALLFAPIADRRTVTIPSSSNNLRRTACTTTTPRYVHWL